MIRLGEFHFFTDEEVDAHSLADRSTHVIQDLEENEGELANFDKSADKKPDSDANLSLSASVSSKQRNSIFIYESKR